MPDCRLRLVLALFAGASGCAVPHSDAAESGSSDAETTAAASEEGEVASTSEEGTGESSESGAEPSSPEMIYLGLCAPCHGADALGTALGYELRHPPREYARWVVRNGRDGGEFAGATMAAFSEASIADDDLEAIFDWLEEFPQPVDGQALYLDYCGNCHGPDARGGVVEKDISDKGFSDALEKVRRGEGGTNYGARTLYMPAIQSHHLDDEEIAAITEYLASL